MDSITVGTWPFGVTVHPNGGTVNVANSSSDTVSVIDTVTEFVVATVAVGDNPNAFGNFVAPLLNSLIISPASGVYVSTQAFDLTLIAKSEWLTVTGGTATLDDVDVSAQLTSCVIPGTLISGGQTFRCPGLMGFFLTEGTHTLSVTLDLSDGSSVSDSVTWEVVANTEP